MLLHYLVKVETLKMHVSTKIKSAFNVDYKIAADVTNLCFVHALLHNLPNFIICTSVSMKLYDTFYAIFCGGNSPV